MQLTAPQRKISLYNDSTLFRIGIYDITIPILLLITGKTNYVLLSLTGCDLHFCSLYQRHVLQESTRTGLRGKYFTQQKRL